VNEKNQGEEEFLVMSFYFCNNKSLYKTEVWDEGIAFAKASLWKMIWRSSGWNLRHTINWPRLYTHGNGKGVSGL